MQTLFRWLARMPLRQIHLIGGVIGWLAFWLSSSYRRRVVANAAQAGVARELWRASIAEAGRMAAELPYLWLRPPHQPIDPPPRWDGAEHLEHGIARGHGLVLMTPHIGCFEVIAQAYAERFGARSPMTAMYRPPRHESLRKIVETARARPGLLTAPASLGGVRQMIRALRRGETVGLLPDQVPPEGLGIWAPFFGRDAYTMTLAARLVEQTGATPLLLVGERLARAAGFCIHVMPMPEPLPADGAGDAEHQRACAGVINRAMEHVIARWPGQYVWGYDRYKAPRSGAGAQPLA